ncbi:hypothetical protein ACI6PS_08700 [Flavobacterium sp. PLA-1-15]
MSIYLTNTSHRKPLTEENTICSCVIPTSSSDVVVIPTQEESHKVIP